MPTVKARNKVCKHIQANDLYYVDLSPLLSSGETVSSATAVATDSVLVVGTPAVLAADTIVQDEHSKDVLLLADKAVSINLSAGTVGEWILTVTLTKSTAKIDAIDCLIEIDGQSA